MAGLEVTVADIIGQASKKLYPGARYIGARRVNGGVVPVLRVPAWREPNEDGRLREIEAEYLGPLIASMGRHLADQDRRNREIVEQIR